jgi:RNA polymerase primary sigma factor
MHMLHRTEQDVPLGAFEQYRREIKWIAPLSEEEEQQLLWQVQCNDQAQQARERLVEGYQSLVLDIARRYERYCRELDLLDLVQEGNIGLLQACARYGGSQQGSSFRTWAYAWIRGRIRCALLLEGSLRLPLRKAHAVRQMRAVNMRLATVLGREPKLEETACEMGMKPWQVHELLVLQAQRMVSLDVPLDEDGELLLHETLVDPSAHTFAEEGFFTVEDVLRSLTGREQVVMKLRYGLDDGFPRTQREVAELLGMKLSMVQGLDVRAKWRLRRALVA